jgi:hypothetical protein
MGVKDGPTAEKRVKEGKEGERRVKVVFQLNQYFSLFSLSFTHSCTRAFNALTRARGGGERSKGKTGRGESDQTNDRR